MPTFAFNRDCMEAMREFPDKFFDLAVVDPPYGGGATVSSTHTHTACTAAARTLKNADVAGSEGTLTVTISRPPVIGPVERSGGGWASRYGRAIQHWDVAPPAEYFQELARVSKHQIIWGGNYFDLPPTRCFIVWRKTNIPAEGFSMAPVEYAWTSFNDNARIFEAGSAALSGEARRIHPTQKPVALYAWIFKLYAKPGYKILDTHLGSGSSRIAAHDAGLHFWGYEIDKVYFELQEERFAKHAAQMNLFL